MKRFHFGNPKRRKASEYLEPDAVLELPSVEAARQAADQAIREMVGELPPGPGKVALIVRDKAGAIVDGIELAIRPLKRAGG